ncbi:ABC transporter permease [Nonomuraea glycinis]|jgi:ABC-2 type transport system permease protein|nr:ABC transporter permease [Nonomuraea glycinis]MCA2177236.1 ABC transporter permease [Nonomuraea glycinis]WSG66631.1 ABC transporter permease [Nonomuraea glycinis]
MMLYYAWTEALRTLRNRRYTIFVVLFPVALYLINAGIYGDQPGAAGVRQSVYLMVQMAGYGALGASMMSSAVPWAQERRSGWLSHLRITPLPGWAIVVTKLAIAMLLVLPSLVLVFAVAVLQQGVSMPLGRWAALAAVMWLGAIPFVALGLAIGSLLSPEAAQPAAVLLVFALSLLGGLWFPVEVMGGTFQAIAELTPSYHYAGLGWSVVASGGLALGDVLTVTGWGIALGGAAAYLYRRATVRA